MTSLTDVARELLKEEAKERPENTVIPSITNLADVTPEEVEFVWEPYVPLGKLTFLEGDPGIGKTFLALYLCAAISNNILLPDQDGMLTQVAKQGTVLYMTAEDDLGDTLVPRLNMLGADLSMIKCMTGYHNAVDDEEKPFTLQKLAVLKKALEDVRPVLVVIDPLQAYLGNGVDMHRANETRPILSGLAKLAKDYQCAILIIRHLNKSGSSKAIYRGIGTIDFTAAARSIIFVVQEPNTGRIVMLQIKSSCASAGVSQSFELQPDHGFTWCGISRFKVEELLASPLINNNEKYAKSDKEEAIEFLNELLACEPLLVNEIRAQAKLAGISFRTLERAKTQLGFKAYRQGKHWYWPQLNDINISGGLGGLVPKPDVTGITERPPTPPIEESGGEERDAYFV